MTRDVCPLQRGSQFYGTFDFTEAAFDWGTAYKRPAVPASEYVVYEVPLRTFTASASSGLPESRRGTFLGFMDKVSLSPAPELLRRHADAAPLAPSWRQGGCLDWTVLV